MIKLQLSPIDYTFNKHLSIMKTSFFSIMHKGILSENFVQLSTASQDLAQNSGKIVQKQGRKGQCTYKTFPYYWFFLSILLLNHLLFRPTSLTYWS